MNLWTLCRRSWHSYDTVLSPKTSHLLQLHALREGAEGAGVGSHGYHLYPWHLLSYPDHSLVFWIGTEITS